MQNLHKLTRSCCASICVATLLLGCTSRGSQFTSDVPLTDTTSIQPYSFDYHVTPEDFSLTLDVEGNQLVIADAVDMKIVDHLQESKWSTHWTYPEEEIEVVLEKKPDYLHVSISSTSTQDSSFTWPHISSDEYYLPLGEGKRVPADDIAWKNYLGGNEFSVLEQFSMPFWATSMGEYAVIYIMENPTRTHLNFSESEQLTFNVSYDFLEIKKDKTQKYRIYVTQNDPVAIAKVYRNYVIENGDFLTLKEKEKQTPDIKNLYGAPFIYLWGSFILSPNDIQWRTFKESLDNPIMNYFLTFVDTQENGAEFKTTLEEISNQDYISVYQKSIICSYISGILTEEHFWNSSLFVNSTPAMNQLLKKGIEQCSDSEKIQLYKLAIDANLPGVFSDPSTWMSDQTTDLIKDLKKSGLDTAWIGLHGYEQAFNKPELVTTAIEQNYLIASYDSYHSIHKPGSEQWETAKFNDLSLYENATVANKEGKKYNGFQNVGRKLNPILAFPSVKERTKRIMEENNLTFNSWFIDCDATGEVYDDYSPSQITTKEEDIAARMERMSYIGNTYDMVIGSEGGNDFAASTIAYAHGIELKSFSWMDEDMKKNKESDYYIGRYYNPTGGVAEHFSKRVPLKEEYYTLFVDPRYDLPLYKLVYNDSVISSYHWEWSTFKIKDATQTRMAREILYNVPPLFHLDATEWEEYKEDIVNHTSVWSVFAKEASKLEMTNFEYLTKDGLVQSTQYGKDIRVIANFGDTPYPYQNKQIPAVSVLIDMNNKVTLYTPLVEESHK